MKNNLPYQAQHHRCGFTLVELLVVITIVAVLAALGFVSMSKLRQRADGAVSISNLRQIGPFLMTHASDNNGNLPAPRGDSDNGSGGYTQMHWHETVMIQTYSGINPELLKNKQWWLDNKPFIKNPLCDEDSKQFAFDWWNPGYAMNMRIARNLGLVQSEDWAPGKNGPQTNGVPVALIPDPARTPIIAPRANWHYEYTPAQIKEEGLKQFLVDQKIPILFVDGHVESMKLEDYTDRNLHLMPKKDS